MRQGTSCLFNLITLVFVALTVVVLCGSIGKPAVGDFVSVRGAATTVAAGERIRRAVLVDDESDVVTHVGSHAAD